MAWTSSQGYTIGYRPVATHRISTSETELLHLLIAGAVLTFDFALLGTEFSSTGALVTPNFLLVPAWLPYGATAALTAFVAHEMAHKLSAQRHGFWAEFRMSPVGLVISLVTALAVGVMFAAPGATMIGGMGDTREWGRTSLAGPLTNLVMGGGFALATAVAWLRHTGAWLLVPLALLTFINTWFSTFNLLPFGPLDGRKVYRWSGAIWGAAFAASAAAAALAFFLASALIGAV
jgi:Zn-dependent protease